MKNFIDSIRCVALVQDYLLNEGGHGTKTKKESIVFTDLGDRPSIYNVYTILIQGESYSNSMRAYFRLNQTPIRSYSPKLQ